MSSLQLEAHKLIHIYIFIFISIFYTEYFNQQELNVISVDFRHKVVNYYRAVKDTPSVGNCVGVFLHNLFKARKDLILENLHVIGFSLGAHVAGHAGRYLKTQSLEIPRITGTYIESFSWLSGTIWNSNLKTDKLKKKTFVLHSLNQKLFRLLQVLIQRLHCTILCIFVKL